MKILLMVIILSVLLGLVFLIVGIQILVKKGHKFPRFYKLGHKSNAHTIKKTDKSKSKKESL